MLFFLSQYKLSYGKLEFFLYCNQVPEGSPFGLIFKDNEVAQIGIENFEKILDYKENFRKKGNYFIWYNVTLNTKTLKLHIGNQEKHSKLFFGKPLITNIVDLAYLRQIIN